MQWAKDVVGKIATGLVALAVIAGGISWWQMDPADRSGLIGATAKFAGWFVAVLAVPWVGMLLVRRVAAMGSNAASAVLIGGLTLLEGAWLLWLLGGVQGRSPGSWTIIAAAVLAAGVYNLLTCDWIAERFG